MSRLKGSKMRALKPPPKIPESFRNLLDSDRASARTRYIMEERAQTCQGSSNPRHLSERAYAVLRCVSTIILPQDDILGNEQINLASEIDTRLGGEGDGWRFLELPSDRQAFEEGLLALRSYVEAKLKCSWQETPFKQRQEALKAFLRDPPAVGTWRGDQVTLWLSDLRAACVQAFLCQPAVQGALGIDAVINGGDDVFQGFDIMGEGQQAPWEPQPSSGGNP